MHYNIITSFLLAGSLSDIRSYTNLPILMFNKAIVKFEYTLKKIGLDKDFLDMPHGLYFYDHHYIPFCAIF